MVEQRYKPSRRVSGDLRQRHKNLEIMELLHKALQIRRSRVSLQYFERAQTDIFQSLRSFLME